MLTYLHDIRNKLTLISGQTAILSKKYGEEDFLPIRTNLVRISDIINDAYHHLNDGKESGPILFTPKEFIRQLDLLVDAAQLLFPLEFTNDVRSYNPKKFFNIEFNVNQIFQVIENAIDNSLKANSTKLIVRLFDTNSHCIFELVDNGTEKNSPEENSYEVSSSIPHGIGKEIMINNMENHHGKIEWIRRLDDSGMIVRLYFPKL